MLEDQPAHLGVVLAEHAHHHFRLGGLGEGSEAAEIEEHHGDLPPMGQQRIVRSPGDDKLGELG